MTILFKSASDHSLSYQIWLYNSGKTFHTNTLNKVSAIRTGMKSKVAFMGMV